MKAAVGLGVGLLVGAALGWGVAHNYSKGRFGQVGGVAGLGGGDVALFQLDGQSYTSKDVPAEVNSELFETQYSSYERAESLLTQFALRLSLAKEKNKDVKLDSLPEFGDLLNVPKPTDDEVKQVFEANKSRLPPNMTFEQVKPEIEKFVANQKVSEVMRAKVTELKQANRFKTLIPEPVAPAVTLNLASYPSKGTASAAHTLAEASDYLCPHCQELQPEVEGILKENGDKMKFVQINYSLRPEGLSGLLARGAFCARKQGDEAYWRYHQLGYKMAQEKGWKLTDPESKDVLKELATAANVDVAKIDECVGTPDAKAFLEQTLKEMKTAGVTGTPTFFLSGRKLVLKAGGLRGAVQQQLGASSH